MSIGQTYILYYSIIITTSFIVYLSESMRNSRYRVISKYIFIISMVIPIMISSIRYGIGTDYFTYESIYHLLGRYTFFWEPVIQYGVEPSWVLLNNFVEILFNNSKYIFFISSLLIIILNFKAISFFKEHLNITIAVFIFMCTLYFPSFNMIRFSIAAAILLIALKYIKEKKSFKYILMVLFASSFHYTAFIFLPLYWFLNYKNKIVGLLKKSVLYLSFIILILGFDIFYNILINIGAFSKYGAYELGSNKFGIGNIVIRFPVILLILLNLINLKRKDPFMYNITILYFISFLLQYLGYRAIYIDRVAIYFEMTQILILGSIVKIQTNKPIKLLICLMIFIYFIVLFTYTIILQNNHETVPYIWIK